MLPGRERPAALAEDRALWQALQRWALMDVADHYAHQCQGASSVVGRNALRPDVP